MDELTSFKGQARLEITDFATWYMGFGGLEKDFSECLLSLGGRCGKGERLDGVFDGGCEGRPVGLPVVGIAVWSGFCWRDRESSVETDDDKEVVGVESSREPTSRL